MKSSHGSDVAWVFGASGVLGREITAQLIEKGNRVIAFAYKNPVWPQSIGDSQLLKVQLLDLRDPKNVIELVSQLNEAGLDPSVVYFCARGKVVLDETLKNTSGFETEFVDDYMISILTPALITIKLLELAANLEKIIFFSSQYAQVAQTPTIYSNPEQSISALYSAHKGAVISLARALSVKAIEKGVVINVFTVGGIRESTSEELAKSIQEIIPLKRMLGASEIAKAIVQISEVFGSGLVGSNIVIDGGWTTI